METLFSWLHLSDLLIDPKDGRGRERMLVSLKEDATRLAKETVSPDVILVTGDLTDRGQDYSAADTWLRELAAVMGLKPEDVLVVPGNHDVDRLTDKDRHVARLLRGLREGTESLDEVLQVDEDRALLKKRLQRYLDFASRLGSLADEDPLYWTRVREGRRCRVRLMGINTALLATMDEDRGKLRVGTHQLLTLGEGRDDLIVALMHHPPAGGWLADERLVISHLRHRAHVLLSSHFHESAPHKAHELAPIVPIGAGHGGGRVQLAYNMAAIQVNAEGLLKLRVWPRRWSAANADFRLDVDSVQDGHIYSEHTLEGARPRPGQEVPPTLEPRPEDDTPTSTSERRVGYLSSIQIQNIRMLQALKWSLEAKPGWNVLIGDNGSGKSTTLRAIALALLGGGHQGEGNTQSQDSALALRVDLKSWINKGMGGEVSLHLDVADAEGECVLNLIPSGAEWNNTPNTRDVFSAGFGPFRRFSGGDPEYERQFSALPRVSRYLSLFDERVSMTETLRWLKDLQFKALTDSISGGRFIEQLKNFINQEGFLPNGVKLGEITPEEVRFEDASGSSIPIDTLSDGYRSILSLTLELMRQLAAHHGAANVFGADTHSIIAPGIVLIDEADVHLHPTWQQEIGQRLKKLFPRIQFIVTTHSPLVCQAADSVFLLPRLGTGEPGRMLEGVELSRLQYGNVLDAYGTGAFGQVTRSEKGQQLLERLAELNVKEINTGLSPDEEKQQEQLRATFPTARIGGERRG